MEAAKKKKHLGHRDGGWKVFLAIMAIIALIPLLYALSLSFRTQNSIFDPRLFVTDLTTGNISKRFQITRQLLITLFPVL